MKRRKRNVTLAVDEDLLLAARKAALERGASVNQLFRQFLASLGEESGRRRMARARLEAAFDIGLVDAGERTWSREELYER